MPRPLSCPTLPARDDVTTATALHLLHRPGQTEAQGRLDNVKVMEPQQAEKAVKNVHRRAAWRDAPKIQSRNRVQFGKLV